MDKKAGHGQEGVETVSSAENDSKKPSPDNFDAYVPWACIQLELCADIVLIKIRHNEYISPLTDRSKASKSRTKRRPLSRIDLDSDEETKENVLYSQTNVSKVKIYSVYDSYNNLVQLKFDNNKNIPTKLLQIIGLIIHFQTHLTNVTINKGLNNASLYELNKMINLSNINDVCLDNTVIADANYDILLDNKLRYLSLSRCKIEDDILKKITAKLLYPLETSKALSTLNLASNRISDIGAKYIADVLRANRQLVYLNLADNFITDEGAIAILNTLKEFSLTEEELISSKTRFIKYWQEKQKIMLAERPAEDKKMNRRKSVKASTVYTESARKSKIEKENFVDPFSSKNTTVIDDHLYCYGNNHLSYVNFAYNNLTYFTVKTLVTVLKRQIELDRTPRGLINISIEGNNIPTSCKELVQIEDMLETILSYYCKNFNQNKKKAQLKQNVI